MTHDDGDSGNVRLVENKLKKENKGYYFNRITKTEVESVKKLTHIINFFLSGPTSLPGRRLSLWTMFLCPWLI